MTSSNLVLSGGDRATSSLPMRSSLSRDQNPVCHLHFHSSQQSHLNNKRKHEDLPQLFASRWPFQFQSLWAPEQKNWLFQALDSPTPKIQEQEKLGWPYFLLLGAGISHMLIEGLWGFPFISRHTDSIKLFLKYFKATHHLQAHTGSWCLPTGLYVHAVPVSRDKIRVL